MRMLDLLKKYELSKDVICDHFTQKMIASLDEDDDVPDEFKEFLRQTKIDDENLSKMLDVNPRTLFDIFDDNHLYIQITRNSNENWDWEVAGVMGSGNSRRQAEMLAVEKAAELLNEKLKKNEGPHRGTISEKVSETQ